MLKRITSNCALISLLALLGIKDIEYVKSSAVSIDPYLYGIGYYEAVAQNGIDGISMAGGAEIVIYGQGMSHTPANTHALFTNALMGSSEAGPPTAQDVAFSTHTDGGKLKYSTPTLMALHDRPYEAFSQFESITYDVSLYDFDEMTQQISQLSCKKSSAQKCKVTISRAMTPILYEIMPKVIYPGSELAFYLDPRLAQNKKSQLLPEFPFVEVRINGYGVDFEGWIEEDTVLQPYAKSQVRGIMGAITPSSSADIYFRFRVGYALHQESSMLRCSYDNSTCYKAKAVAVINSIDQPSGYTTGNQLITVKGHGFNSRNISAIIDGVPCLVQSSNLDQFTCITGPQPNPSNQSEYVGQHGIRRRYFNTTYRLSFANMATSNDYTEMLAMDLEAPINVKDGHYGNIYSGYFKAPATAGYRFYIACDDSCIINFSNVSMNSSQKTLIYQSNSWAPFRNYFTLDGKKMTSWLNLTKDNYYYIEVYHVQFTGGDDLSVSVEINDPNLTPGHFNTMREIQRLQINPTNIRDTMNITILNPDGGEFQVNIINPKDNSLFQSAKLNTNSSTTDFYNALVDYYVKTWGCGIGVWKTMYDINDTVTSDFKLSVKNVITIALNRQISSASTNQMSIFKVSTKSTFQLALPKNYQLSSAPLTGSFQIQCTLPDGTTNTTADISSGASLSTIYNQLIIACSNLREKVEISDGNKYNYYDDGRDIVFRLIGMNFDYPQLQIISSSVKPLSGNNISIDCFTWIPYDPTRIFYEPLPFDFMYTKENMPQVIVSVDGIEAVCDSLQCGYSYVEPTAQINSFNYSLGVLTVIGTGFVNKIREITFSNIPCLNVQILDSQTITCQVTAVSGTWQPVIIDSNGLIPLNTTDTIIVQIQISGSTPNVNLNPFGGTQIYISGANLPQTTSDSTQLSIVFSDGTLCDVEKVNATMIICETQQFAQGTTNVTMNISINGLSDTSQSFALSSGPAVIAQIVPNSVSPVLKNILTLTVVNFTGTLDPADLSVSVTSQTNSSIVRYINIIEVGTANSFQSKDIFNNQNYLHNDTQYLKVKFGGSESGIYQVNVRSSQYGKFDTTGITLELVGRVTSFYPAFGSIYGGTLVTINGYHFSNDPQDNPVRVGYSDCMVETSNETQITCRTMPFMDQVDGKDDFLVFLKTYEQALCDVDPCTFQWVKTGLAAVTSYTVNFDSTLNDYVLTLFGTNFSANTTNTQVYIDNIEQKILTASDDQVQVQIVNVSSSFTRNVNFYLPIGLPDGTEDLTINTGIALTPQFLSLTPNAGSLAGSIITAIVKGVGINTPGVSLVDQNGAAICETVTIIDYGVIQCKTKALRVQTLASMIVKVGNITYPCVGTNGECDYQTTNISMPNITSVTQQDSQTLIFTGTGFLVAGFNANVVYAGVSASTVQIIDDNQVTAVFQYGVPISQNLIIAQLILQSQTDATAHWATSKSTLKNALAATQLDQPVSCSFAGGCTISISQPGLLSNLMADPVKNQITVCNSVCTPDLNSSSASAVQCNVPSLATTYSIENYKIMSESYLMGTPFSSRPQLTMTLFDGSHQNGWNDTTANCFFGTGFRAGYIGVINEVKYFMTTFNKANFIGKLQFQGSQNNLTWTTIFTVGQEIHEGWNYYNFPAGQELKYRFFRYFGTAQGSCLVGEITFRGFEVIDDNQDSYSCLAQVTLNGTALPSLTGSITYQSSLTPLLNSISPRFGTVVGGELVTFTGANFVEDPTLYSILIDDKICTVQNASTTSVSCITSKRPGLFEPSLIISITGMGNVATQGLVFRYCNYWSHTITWGGEFAPITGDMVYVPAGLHLLVDVDSTPVLSAVVVEGSLIFPPDDDPNHLRTFDAHYVLIRGGYFEAGTEQFPYTSKLQITMHSTRDSPELPIFGNKVIAMYDGTLDLHGVPRHPTWTSLDTTSDIGSNTITLIEAVDWKVGERIIVAPTGYYNTEAEERTIISVDNSNPDKPILTLDQPFEFKHYAGVETYGGDFIEMRAEVGLLTRNILYRGDPETSAKNEYGAHIMVHSDGGETLTARIQYIELFNVGQAFQLGRYPIHFHLIGAVHNSYIMGNAIHQSYNRACTIHGVHYLRIIDNVAYNVKGHTFFIEDAAETHNYLEHNLAVLTKKSWSLLNSDQTPACFWITHPNNIFRRNHCAGADNYGFWFDTKPNPTGPSFDPNQCPENSPLGEFTNNVAHSCGRYGLRLFHKLKPRLNPCSDIIYDPNNTTDPYWQNPVITAVFENFTSFKNQRNGAIALDMGAVVLKNFKVADNILAGIEFELTNTLVNGYCYVDGALVIGRSGNADFRTNTSKSHGIIGPRTENFQIHNVSFYNFDVADKAALGTCSHCFSAPSTDSGGRTVTTSNLYFDSSVKVKIRYQEPWREIFFDTDGTLTGLGPNTFATSYWKHNDQPECTRLQYVYDGLICNSSVQVRRLVFYNYAPSYFKMMDMKVLKFDDSLVGSMDNVTLQSYILNKDNYSIAPMREKANPLYSWALPYVTGKKYKIHWQYGLDYTQMQIDLSPRWSINDSSVYFIHNFTDVRAQIDFITAKDNIKNMTLLSNNPNDLQTGANIVYNDTPTRQTHFIINGKNQTRTSLVMVGRRCVGPCLAAITTVATETNIRYWSNASSWNNSKVPLAGEDIVIPSGQNFVFDLPVSPIYNYIQINGRVTFLESAPSLHLQAKYIFVRAGQLIIGNQTNPFKGQAKITLYGEFNSASIVYTDAIEAGNKILANTGQVSMYGSPRIQRTRLRITALKGDNKITVEPGLGWQANEQIGLASTRVKSTEQDFAIISAYDNATGVLTLDRKLSYYHWGQTNSTAPDYKGIDMRGEVVLLSRNIKIIGNDSENWGCQFLTGDFVEGDGALRQGNTVLDFVEVYNCSQYDTFKAALRFEGASGAWSQISNSAVHHGHGYGIAIMGSENVKIVNTTVFDFVKFGVEIARSQNVTIDNTWVIGIYSRNLVGKTMGDPMGGILGCASHNGGKCDDIKITNNVVAGIEEGQVDVAGYSTQAHECGDYKTITFRNNIAHSIAGNGAIIFRNGSYYSNQNLCLEASYFTAYKCRDAGIVSNQATDQVIFSNMVLIDNGYSAIAMVGQEGTNQWAKLINITFYGETDAHDCDTQNICQTGYDKSCIDKAAILPSCFAGHSKPALISSVPAWPQWKMKADASFGGTNLYQNLSFINFQSGSTWCGAKQRLFMINKYAADYTPLTKLTNTRFENVNWDSFAYFYIPPQEWAVIDDCGQFPCTGPNNVLLKFSGSTYGGNILPIRTERDFQLISGVPEARENYTNCFRYDKWNGYYCQNENIAMLTFESTDYDKLTRILSPIQVINLNVTSRNVLNTFMDHLWDGFYTSLKRLSRFPTLIEGGKNIFYQIIYTSTPPQNQTFSLKADYTSVIIRIKYSKPGVYIVKDLNGNEIRANAWDNTIQGPGLIKSRFCGENRYVGVINILEFYLGPNCNITISPIDSIQSSVRLNWTLNEFYGSGGTTKFVDRIAASLGIKVANVKVVSVYQGSVFVDFHVVDDSSGTVASKGGLDTVQNVLTQKLSSNQVDLGAPILSVSVTSVKANQTSASSTTPQTPIIIIPPSANTQATKTSTQGGVTVTQAPIVTPIIQPPPSPIVQPAQIITKNNTIVVVTSDDQKAGSNSPIMIAVICSIVGLIIFGGALGYYIYKKFSRTRLTALDQNSQVIDSHKNDISAMDPQANEIYEKQYDPKSEMDIFGRGDPFKKGNEADDVDEDDFEGQQSIEQQAITEVDISSNMKLNAVNDEEQIDQMSSNIFKLSSDNKDASFNPRSIRNANDEELGMRSPHF